MFNERLNPKTELKIVQTLAPRIIISQDAHNKMWNYVSQCADEIGWLGSIEKHGSVYYLKDVYLFEQEVHATTTEISPDGLGKFAEQLLAQPDGMDVWNSIKLWGHSHVNMAVFPSGQDDAQMKTFSEAGHEHFFRLIANKKGDLKIDMFDYANGIIFIDVAWELLTSVEEETIATQIAELEKQLEALRNNRAEAIKEDIVAEMKEKVKKKTYTYAYGGSGTYMDYNKKKWVQPHWQKQEDGTDRWISGYYRDKTPEEIAEEEKKTTNNSSYGTNTSGTTTNIVPFSQGNNFIGENQLAVLLDNFVEEDLIDIGHCLSMEDVAHELRRQGYSANYFTWNEKKAIWEYAYSKLKEHYAAMGVVVD